MASVIQDLTSGSIVDALFACHRVTRPFLRHSELMIHYVDTPTLLATHEPTITPDEVLTFVHQVCLLPCMCVLTW